MITSPGLMVPNEKVVAEATPGSSPSARHAPAGRVSAPRRAFRFRVRSFVSFIEIPTIRAGRCRAAYLALRSAGAQPRQPEQPESEEQRRRGLRNHELARVDAEDLPLALAREVGQRAVRDQVGRDRIDRRMRSRRTRSGRAGSPVAGCPSRRGSRRAWSRRPARSRSRADRPGALRRRSHRRRRSRCRRTWRPGVGLPPKVARRPSSPAASRCCRRRDPSRRCRYRRSTGS